MLSCRFLRLGASETQYCEQLGRIIADPAHIPAVGLGLLHGLAQLRYKLINSCTYCTPPTPNSFTILIYLFQGRSVVVAVDDSDEGYAAVAWVIQHLWRPGDVLHVLHVVRQTL